LSPDEILILVGSGAFGAVVGSFLNVVIHRLPRPELSVARPRRSVCPACGTQIVWYDNLPVLSWILLRGRCRACRAGISPRYPAVEALTALLFAVLAARIVVAPGNADADDWLRLLATAAFTAALVAASFIDFEHRIIPDRITKPGMLLAPLVSLVVPALHQTHWLEGVAPRPAALILSAMGIAVGAGAIWGMGVLGRVVFRKEAMGFGDVKFMGFVGGMLGPVGVLLAIFLACLVGSVIGVFILIFKRDHYLPFGPYLSLGSLGILLFRPEIVRFVTEDWTRAIRGWLG
jgi:leader peptidase (prepilin peptidase)/N-methyltransferase